MKATSIYILVVWFQFLSMMSATLAQNMSTVIPYARFMVMHVSLRHRVIVVAENKIFPGNHWTWICIGILCTAHACLMNCCSFQWHILHISQLMLRRSRLSTVQPHKTKQSIPSRRRHLDRAWGELHFFSQTFHIAPLKSSSQHNLSALAPN